MIGAVQTLDVDHARSLLSAANEKRAASAIHENADRMGITFIIARCSTSMQDTLVIVSETCGRMSNAGKPCAAGVPGIHHSLSRVAVFAVVL